MKREFADASQVKKTTMMTRLMHLVHEMTKKGIHATKRDLFYADVKLFEKQTNSDGLLEELALMLGCTRHSLMVTASEKGVVIGRVQFKVRKSLSSEVLPIYLPALRTQVFLSRMMATTSTAPRWAAAARTFPAIWTALRRLNPISIARLSSSSWYSSTNEIFAPAAAKSTLESSFKG